MPARSSGLISKRFLYRTLLRGRLRPLLLGLMAAITLTQVIALFPSSVDDESRAPPVRTTPIDPDALIDQGSVTRAAGIPQRIPEYSVTDFDYVSTQDGEKQWKLLAEKAAMFNKERIVHAREIKAFLFDPDGKATVITGRESKYFMGKRDLEIFGNVVTTFPDGFELRSEYLHYSPARRWIRIPANYAVSGGSSNTPPAVETKASPRPSDDAKLSFKSMGLDFEMARSRIFLPKQARVFLVRPNPKDNTRIESDRCEIDRTRQIAYFVMEASKPLSQRFVLINQPGLFARSRRAEMNYGDPSSSQLLHEMVAYEDVLIRQLPEQTPEVKTVETSLDPSSWSNADEKPTLNYATGGRADFDNRRNLIILTQFPQAYQGNDTVTGDVILVHRDTDVIEVENSNSYSEGSSN